jgi:hypothetical protein
VQPFGRREPREDLAEHAPRGRPWPVEHPDLERLNEVLGPVREDDQQEDVEREAMVRGIQPRDGTRRLPALAIRAIRVTISAATADRTWWPANGGTEGGPSS